MTIERKVLNWKILQLKNKNLRSNFNCLKEVIAAITAFTELMSLIKI